MIKSYRNLWLSQQCSYGMTIENLEKFLDWDTIDQYAYILHDKDKDTEPHIHLVVKLTSPQRTSVILNRFAKCGIDMPENNLLKMKSFEGALTYLCHKLPKDYDKYQYPITDVHTNISNYELIVENYLKKSLATVKSKDDIYQVLFELGKQGKDVSDWYNSVPYKLKHSYDVDKTLQNAYHLGIQDYIKDMVVPRVPIIIWGDTGTGKTSSTLSALNKLGLNTVRVDGGGTGKYDKVSVNTDAIVLDDEFEVERIKQLGDIYPCPVYRRGSNNPIFIGQYYIITTNLSPIQFEQLIYNQLETDKTLIPLNQSVHLSAVRRRYWYVKVDGVNVTVQPPQGAYTQLYSVLNYKDTLTGYDDYILQFNPLQVEQVNAFLSFISVFSAINTERCMND